MELKPAFYSIETSGHGHLGHTFSPEEIIWNHVRTGGDLFRARKLFNPCLGSREEWKLWWGSGGGQQDTDNKLPGILAGREPDQRDKDGPWRRFLHLQLEGQGSSWRSLWSPKKGLWGQCRGQGLSHGLRHGQRDTLHCLVFFLISILVFLKEGLDTQAAVTGTVICFLLPFSVQFPRWTSTRGLWEEDSHGKSWWAASRSWVSLHCPPSVGLQHRGSGGSVLSATGRPGTSLPVGLWMDVSWCCPPLITVPLGLVGGFPEDGVQGQFEVHRLLLPGGLSSWRGQRDGAEVWEHPWGHPHRGRLKGAGGGVGGGLGWSVGRCKPEGAWAETGSGTKEPTKQLNCLPSPTLLKASLPTAASPLRFPRLQHSVLSAQRPPLPLAQKPPPPA